MAGISWIKVETTLPNKPIVLKLRRILQKSRSEIVGMLVQLLCWADGATNDGSLADMLPEDLDYIVNCPGFGQALIDAGWMSASEDGMTFVNWDKHNGQSAKRRADIGRNVEAHRAKKQCNQNVITNDYTCNQDEIKADKLDKIRIDKKKANAFSNERVREKVSAPTNSGETFALQNGSETIRIPKDHGNDRFLDEYAKKPKSVRAFQVEWANAVKREDPEILIACARLYRESMTGDDYRYQLAPENWLADCRYDQFKKDAKQSVKQKETATALPTLPWEE